MGVRISITFIPALTVPKRRKNAKPAQINDYIHLHELTTALDFFDAIFTKLGRPDLDDSLRLILHPCEELRSRRFKATYKIDKIQTASLTINTAGVYRDMMQRVSQTRQAHVKLCIEEISVSPNLTICCLTMMLVLQIAEDEQNAAEALEAADSEPERPPSKKSKTQAVCGI